MGISSLSDLRFRNPTLQMIKMIYDDYEKEVDMVKKSWNNKIRDFLRDKMGVKLINEKRETIPVPVRIMASFDRSIIDIIESRYADLDFDLYYNLLQFIDNAKKVQPHFVYPLSVNAIQYSIDYAEKLLMDYPFKELKNNLFPFLKNDFNKDIFGCYFIKKHEIEIYILPCILFAKLHNLNLHNLIVIILAHELSHAYNHVGYDKDNLFWDVFEKSDVYVAEGLAQYYTYTFIKYVSEYNPLLMETFNTLLLEQPYPYNKFREWLGKDSYEAVFRTFIEMRRKKLFGIDDFEEILSESKIKLSK